MRCRALLSFSLASLCSIADASILACGQAAEHQPVPANLAVHQPVSSANQREARELYALGLLRLKADRLVDATQAFEHGLERDPYAANLHRALVPLYVALGRTDDALAAATKAVELDPKNVESWTLYARRLKHAGRLADAVGALAKARDCPGFHDRLELRLEVLNELAAMAQSAHDEVSALIALTDLSEILCDPRTANELAGITPKELRDQAAEVFERMIKICVENANYAKAADAYNEIAKRFPERLARLDFLKAKIELARKHPEQALLSIESYLKTQPQGADAYELWLEAARQAGRGDSALEALEQYSLKDSFNVPLRLLLAREYVASGQTRQAEGIYRLLVEQAPTAEVYRALFKLWLQMDRMGDALDQLDAMVNKSEKSHEQAGDAYSAAKARAMLQALRSDESLARAILPAARQKLREGAPLHVQTIAYLAVFAGRLHELAEAEAFYRRCLENRGSDGQQEHAIYSGLIDVLWEGKQYEALVEVCRAGLRKARATNLLLFHRNLSQALVHLDRADEAALEADKAVEMADDRTRFGMRLNRIYILDRLGRFPQALAEGQAMLKEYSEQSQIRDIRYRLSTVYSDMREFAPAQEQLRLILQADPNDAGANNDLGYILADLNTNLDEAERLIRKAIALDDELMRTSSEVGFDIDQGNAAYLDSLGWLLFRRERLAEARTWLEKAAALVHAETDATIWDHLGDVCFRMKDNSAARSAWQKALALYDSSMKKRSPEHYNELKHKLQILDSEARQP
jgi:tetratricopeptide (TPR) repeat protein